MPPSRTAAAGSAAARRGDGFGSSMADIFDDLFGDMMGPSLARRGARGWRRGPGARIFAYIGGDARWRRQFNGKAASLKLPTSVTCDTCSGTGAKAGAKPKAMRDVRRAWPGACAARASSPSSAHARTARGRGRDDRQSLPVVYRHRPCHPRAPVVGQRAGRRRGRDPHPPRRRRRGRHAGAVHPAISTSSYRRSRIPFFQRDGADLF